RPMSPTAKTALRNAESTREDCAIHPIVGAWVVDRVMSAHNDSQRTNNDSVVEFELSTGEVKLTQIATDTTGSEIAITTTVCSDGHEHPALFGEGIRLKALWSTPLMLEATFTTGGRTLSRFSYEVSPDGKSLVMST